MNFLRVKINRSETTTLTRTIPPWELPVLAAVNGDDRVHVIGTLPAPRNYGAPAAHLEYARLETKYKDSPESGQSYVALTFGGGQRGVRTLEDLIAREFAEDVIEVPAEVSPTKTPRSEEITAIEV